MIFNCCGDPDAFFFAVKYVSFNRFSAPANGKSLKALAVIVIFNCRGDPYASFLL